MVLRYMVGRLDDDVLRLVAIAEYDAMLELTIMLLELVGALKKRVGKERVGEILEYVLSDLYTELDDVRNSLLIEWHAGSGSALQRVARMINGEVD